MFGWIRERLGGERRPIEVQIEAPLPPPRSAAALFYQIAREELNHQFAMAAEFDRKTATAFTIGSTILPVTAGLLSTDRDALTANETAVSAILAGFVCYLLLGGCFVIALGSARLDRPPCLAAWAHLATTSLTHVCSQPWQRRARVAPRRRLVPPLDRPSRRCAARCRSSSRVRA